MIQKIKAPITVVSAFDHIKRSFNPIFLKWEGTNYKIKKIGFHHSYRQGRTLYHIFSVVAGDLFFKIIFNTDDLHWELEEIADGVTD